jgi:hypothetical protein
MEQSWWSRTSPVRRMIVMDDLTQSAVERGRQQADTVMEFRFRILEERVDTAEEPGRLVARKLPRPTKNSYGPLVALLREVCW